MSASFHWRPSNPTPPPQGSFGIGLADMMARYLDGYYGPGAVDRDAMLRDTVINRESSMYYWLCGVRDLARGDKNYEEIFTDAEGLINALDEHGSIELDVAR